MSTRAPSTAAPFDLEQVDRLLTTTKSVRRRLDMQRPVERSVITECIRLAQYAPNASNAQDWHWVVVDDPEVRREVAAIYEACLAPRSMLAAKVAEGDEAGARISRSVQYLAERMGDVPAIVIPCFDIVAATERYDRLLGRDKQPPVMEPAMYASILPAVWSFQLALRSRALGSTLTTAHQFQQPEMARVLAIPESWFQVALLPVAYTTGGDFTPSPRGDVDEVILWNQGAGGEW